MLVFIFYFIIVSNILSNNEGKAVGAETASFASTSVGKLFIEVYGRYFTTVVKRPNTMAPRDSDAISCHLASPDTSNTYKGRNVKNVSFISYASLQGNYQIKLASKIPIGEKL